ncbi:MAG: hypothetical protein HRU35_00080 [Rickettsiaceae bacterium]|nr:hypothetical protein [Rickettsiaceae bacterium]
MTQKYQTNYQDLLKMMAMITMVIDHLGLYFFPDLVIMRIIGRYTMPIFCFFVGYNYHKGVSFKILIAGIILYLIQIYIINGGVFTSEKLSFTSDGDLIIPRILYDINNEFVSPDILITIFVGQVYISFLQKYLCNFWFAYSNVVILAILDICLEKAFAYGTLGLAIIVIGFIVKYHKETVKVLAIVVGTLQFIHTEYYFNDFFTFTPIQHILVFVTSFLVYFSLVIKKFDNVMVINIKWLTRNSLSFYVGHLVLIQFAWVCMAFLYPQIPNNIFFIHQV